MIRWRVIDANLVCHYSGTSLMFAQVWAEKLRRQIRCVIIGEQT